MCVRENVNSEGLGLIRVQSTAPTFNYNLDVSCLAIYFDASIYYIPISKVAKTWQSSGMRKAINM
jgi:hypothetical protein